jgi:hypothetical protein
MDMLKDIEFPETNYLRKLIEVNRE